MHQIIQALSDWYNHALQSGGYPMVALMMAVESSLFPLPSEIVIPPAAHWRPRIKSRFRSGALCWRAPSGRGSAPR